MPTGTKNHERGAGHDILSKNRICHPDMFCVESEGFVNSTALLKTVSTSLITSDGTVPRCRPVRVTEPAKSLIGFPVESLAVTVASNGTLTCCVEGIELHEKVSSDPPVGLCPNNLVQNRTEIKDSKVRSFE